MFWGAVSQAIHEIGAVIADGCLKLIQFYIHHSPRMYDLPRTLGTRWDVTAWNLSIAFVVGLAAFLTARWLYGSERGMDRGRVNRD